MLEVLHRKEGKTCAKLVELTIQVSHVTKKVYQVILNKLFIQQQVLTLQANK